MTKILGYHRIKIEKEKGKEMEFTTSYIISQLFVLVLYICLALTYFMKDRKTILILNFIGLAANGITYILLGAYSGLAMCVISLIRNVIFIIDEKKHGKKETNDRKDVIILIVLLTISILLAILTYEGFFSLFSVFATILYTYSVWQKKTRIYKIFGIPIGIMWIVYNIYIASILGIILESVLFICSTTGYLLETRKNKIDKNKKIK